VGATRTGARSAPVVAPEPLVAAGNPSGR
jgi:hypothetical protein